MKKNIKYDGSVLLVEDDDSSRMFIGFIFETFGLKVDAVEDGVKAVERFRSNRYDLIFMDENMPNMSGIEATMRIVELEKEQNLRHTPIVALSGNRSEDDKKRFLDAGADDHLGKPVFKDDLIKKLDKFLR